MSGSVAKQFDRSRRGQSVLNDLARFVQMPAKKLAKGKRWPTRAFWLTVGSELDAKAQPVFTKVGKGDATSMLTLPVALGLQEKMTNQEIAALFVGKEMFARVNELWQEAEEWAVAWDADNLDGNGGHATEDQGDDLTPEDVDDNEF